MSTNSQQIPVPADLLPELRTNLAQALVLLGDDLAHADVDGLDAPCDEIARTIAAHRALQADADTYPRDAVALAAAHTIDDAASRIADDDLTVDEAEFWVRRVRECEAVAA